jgi:GAF domain-containing protein
MTLEEACERLNMAEDLLGDAWVYLENPENYESSQGIIEQLRAYFDFKKSGASALVNQQRTIQEGE